MQTWGSLCGFSWYTLKKNYRIFNLNFLKTLKLLSHLSLVYRIQATNKNQKDQVPQFLPLVYIFCIFMHRYLLIDYISCERFAMHKF